MFWFYEKPVAYKSCFHHPVVWCLGLHVYGDTATQAPDLNTLIAYEWHLCTRQSPVQEKDNTEYNVQLMQVSVFFQAQTIPLHKYPN